MTLNLWRYHRNVDPVIFSDYLSRRIRTNRGAATRAQVRTMIDDPVRGGGEAAMVPFMPRLRPARLALLPLLLTIRRGGLRRCARAVAHTPNLLQRLACQTCSWAHNQLDRIGYQAGPRLAKKLG